MPLAVEKCTPLSRSNPFHPRRRGEVVKDIPSYYLIIRGGGNGWGWVGGTFHTVLAHPPKFKPISELQPDSKNICCGDDGGGARGEGAVKMDMTIERSIATLAMPTHTLERRTSEVHISFGSATYICHTSPNTKV